jgi:hypothetical protein
MARSPVVAGFCRTGEYRDLVQAGILDPTKVVRTALQEAASVGGLLITTEATVAQQPAPAPRPQAPPPGDMGFRARPRMMNGRGGGRSEGPARMDREIDASVIASLALSIARAEVWRWASTEGEADE